jgi:hypothetical protein
MEIRMPNLLTLALVKTMLRILAALRADAAATIGHAPDRMRGRWSRQARIASSAVPIATLASILERPILRPSPLTAQSLRGGKSWPDACPDPG